VVPALNLDTYQIALEQFVEMTARRLRRDSSDSRQFASGQGAPIRKHGQDKRTRGIPDQCSRRCNIRVESMHGVSRAIAPHRAGGLG
jgi:hypothetical protein